MRIDQEPIRTGGAGRIRNPASTTASQHILALRSRTAARGAIPPEIRNLGGQQDAERIRNPNSTTPRQAHIRRIQRDAHEIRNRARTPSAWTHTLSRSFCELVSWKLNLFHISPWTIEPPSGQSVHGIRFACHSIEVRPQASLTDQVPG